MISVKGGTQTWSKAEQQVDLGRDNTKTISALQQDEYFGDQALGDIANKASDPNWIDPSKKVRQVGNAQMDKDAFMKLLLTQMKYQDPTNPMQSHEMAAQLAQFTSLEKLTNISEAIEGLTKAQSPKQNFDALSMIGKAVSGDSSKIDRADDKETHAISFKIQQDAPKAKLVIKNIEGAVVRELEVANLKAGKNEVTWNGQTEEGLDAPKGNYTVSIEAKGSNGAKLFADTKFSGVISGVNFTPQGPIMMVGKQAISLKDIKEIVDPKMVREPEVQQLQVKQPAAKSEASNGQVAGNLENVGLSRGMINQLQKSGAKTSI
ncbi:MAG: flagellar hook assembly protein FlgD [Bdellovibrionales bacterium]